VSWTVLSESGGEDHEQEAGRVSSRSMETTMLGPVIRNKLCRESHPAVEYVYAWCTLHLIVSNCIRIDNGLTSRADVLSVAQSELCGQ
jgi:hypothetical protein